MPTWRSTAGKATKSDAPDERLHPIENLWQISDYEKNFFTVCSRRQFCRHLHAQVDYVDPAMGGQGFMLEPTKPTVSLPNSMVRVYPVRKDQLDDQISSFPLTIISHRLGELFWLMPGDGSPTRGIMRRLMIRKPKRLITIPRGLTTH